MITGVNSYFMYKDFSDWDLYEGFSYGSGTSTQEWIINRVTGKIGLFKDRKTDITTDNFSEKIASDIATVIGIKCASIDLAIRNERIGMISYKINSDMEIIIEGINFISIFYPEYNRNTLIDEKTGEFYSIDIILRSIEPLNLNSELFKVFIFDCIIGNRDRHHSNWAIIKGDNIDICPIYDNASSLCSYVTDEQIDRSFKDEKWLNAQVDTKSKSLIRIKGERVRHSEFVRYLKENYYNETEGFVKNIKEKLTNTTIEEIINKYRGVLSDNKIMLIKEYLKRKRDIVLNIYEIL